MNQGALQKLVNNFVGQLHELFQEEAIEVVRNALSGGTPKISHTSHVNHTAAPSGHAKLPNGVSGQGRGVKRSPEDLEQLAEQFVEFVKANPGLRIEQINKQLGTTTKELALPIRKLVAEDRIKAKGEKRSTTYHPGSARGR